MPYASQRYSADTMNSNCAALGDAAFVGFSRTLNGQTPSRESQYRMPDPMLHSVGQYSYDGEGRRVKKVTDTETTVFVYSLGRVVAEYSTQLSSTPAVHYTTSDHLGSPRVISNELGQVVSRRDFMPFGEEINSGVGGRTSGLNYASNDDDVRQKFTGYERDGESDLDFAQARYYAKIQGRFTTTDPLLSSAQPAIPQTWNRFGYVVNSPLRYVDQTGKCTAPALQKGQVGICFEAFIAAPTVGGIGKGDNRGFNGNNEFLTARVTVSVVVSADEKGVSWKSDTTVSPSQVSVEYSVTENGRIELPDGSTYSSKLEASASLQGTAKTDVELSNMQKVQGERDFGAGVDVTVSIADGKNGFQVNPLTKIAAPAGTIDGSITLRISGSGNVKGLSANGRPFPSYAAYSYTVDADGKTIQKHVHLEQAETPPVSNLTKPVEPFKIIP